MANVLIVLDFSL